MDADLRVSDLVEAISSAPPLSPEDSLTKAARLFRARRLPGLLVAQGRQLVGLVYEADVLGLAAEAPDPTELLRNTRVELAMRPVSIVLSLDQPVAEAARALKQTGLPLAPVVASDGRYLGLLLRRDLLVAIAGEPVLTQIAGLATPFGVHLTTGSLRAGANDPALASTGAALMVMNMIAVNGLEWARKQLHQVWPALSGITPRGSTGEVLEGVATGLASLVVFLLLLRLSPITGSHAAEHMVVHAIEEGEDLALEKVKTEPRVHPRCGTNLVALLVMVGTAWTLLGAVTAANEGVGVLVLLGLVVLVVVTWRRLGHGLQRLITTKPPSDRQLENAIRAGKELLSKAAAHPAPAKPWRRLWNSGFLQVIGGFLAVVEIAEYGPRLLAMWGR